MFFIYSVRPVLLRSTNTTTTTACLALHPLLYPHSPCHQGVEWNSINLITPFVYIHKSFQKHSSGCLVWSGLVYVAWWRAVGRLDGGSFRPSVLSSYAYILAESYQTIINIVLKPTKCDELEKLSPIQMNIHRHVHTYKMQTRPAILDPPQSTLNTYRSVGDSNTTQQYMQEKQQQQQQLIPRMLRVPYHHWSRRRINEALLCTEYRNNNNRTRWKPQPRYYVLLQLYGARPYIIHLTWTAATSAWKQSLY